MASSIDIQFAGEIGQWHSKILIENKRGESVSTIKAGVHMKAVFWLGSMFFMQISR